MNIFKQFYRSLFSPKDIALFRFQGIGKTILYVFLLTFLSIIPSVFYFSSAIVNGTETLSQAVETELPSFKIENGELQSNINAPITISENGFPIIFDSTGTLTEDQLKDTKDGLALLQHDFVFVAGGKVTSYSYSMFGDVALTKMEIVDFLTSFKSMLAVIIALLFIIIYLFSSGIKFIEISILALFGIALKNILGRKLQYRQIWRISAYSITLPTVFFAIMAALQTVVPNAFLINWLVSFTMVMLAIREIPKPKTLK